MRAFIIGLFSICLSNLSGQVEEAVFSLRFQPDWIINGQFAGFYSAVDEGIYSEHGLEVEMGRFSFGSSFVDEVASNRAQIGTVEGYILMNAIAEGEPLVALGAVFQSSPAGYIYFEDSGIRSGNDFLGKRVGVHAYAEELLPYFIRKADIDADQVEAVLVKNDYDKLIKGEIDLLQGFAIDEYLEVKRRTRRGVGFLSFEELGLPVYSMILYTNKGFVNEHPEIVKKFMEATAEGWAFAFQNPDTAAEIVVEAQEDAASSVAFLSEQIRAMQPWVVVEGQELLKTERKRWETMNHDFLEASMIEEPVDLDKLLWEGEW